MIAVMFLIDSNSGGQIQQIASRFGVDWPHLLAQIISFSIVCILLHRFAYKPILKVLHERQRQIAQGLVDTEKIRVELAQAEAKCQEIILQANGQATTLIEEAHLAAARVQQRETQKAIAAAGQILAKSREAAAQEHARMLTELKREVGQLVVRTAVAVTGKILTKDDQRRMAEETISQLTMAA
ncbi:MAG: F0F1 ATP synthase subunit B [Terriglobales bacterium]|jgi:F-type H+-transporting ATPase subunit b